MQWPDLEAALSVLGPAADVLEVGTGHGAMFGRLLGLLRQGARWRLTTIDADAAAVDAAQARVAALPAGIRRRVTARRSEIVDFASAGASGASGAPFHVVIASALLSAVPLVRPWGLLDVLAAMSALVAPGGMLFLEDYLPLAAPETAAAPAACGDGQTAAIATAALWRLYKAIAELSGTAHYQEVPPAWVAARLGDLGFGDVQVSTDERRQRRAPEELAGLVAQTVKRPAAIEEGLWFALDRCRRAQLEAIAAAGGLVQWSGWYRIRATRA